MGNAGTGCIGHAAEPAHATGTQSARSAETAQCAAKSSAAQQSAGQRRRGKGQRAANQNGRNSKIGFHVSPLRSCCPRRALRAPLPSRQRPEVLFLPRRAGLFLARASPMGRASRTFSGRIERLARNHGGDNAADCVGHFGARCSIGGRIVGRSRLRNERRKMPAADEVACNAAGRNRPSRPFKRPAIAPLLAAEA